MDEHLERFGPVPWSNFPSSSDLIEWVEASGLRGRGGAGFPTATKMSAVAAGRSQPVIVANGAEGEPASQKDRLLLTSAPHLVLDGAALAGAALNARQVLICVKSDAGDAWASLEAALQERERAGGDPVDLQLAEVSGRYVAGEESALVNELNGGPPKPTFVPPRPFERGVGRRPTLVHNVETFAHLALIGRFGPAWFRELGTAADPGTQLVTLSGAVENPGVYEIAGGTDLTSLVEAAGGTSAPVQAFLIGGYSGTWFAGGLAPKLRLAHAELRAMGGSLGPGIVIALPVGACAAAETARVTRYLADESAGQCGPCVFGLDAVARTMEEIAAGTSPPLATGLIEHWSSAIAGRGACRHPDGALRMVMSSLKTFAEEIANHEAGRPCAVEPAMRDLLPMPSPYEAAL